ncbi:MAG: hypothetical protein A2Z59_05975 [Nitrospinae bacterium RIFCSPLOWO2_02_39_17]|nr:MAG: hypothetical protein A2W53_02440 [Nitrospinae bacterium RIFCSPHIGHO2_02_39_11]OGW00341.1 MAG: hypothetical protein A3D97_05125 [Nitrospinae bacterium RIFCSPHIGHO2_12_FULL_39_42]OGW05186.1 MAG: hypothetical protein A2Z59_05975 [Nitrospinae bacterium RIFCSPLOWO2_02_39_17]OGW07993.1 MAG: hypothetical protein A2W75_03880 [Nitrospinae bacterium RIFCSPLOWO2_12_39_15]
MSKIIVITYPDMAVGYRFAGVEVIEVAREDNFAEVMNKVMEREDLGVIAIEDTILNSLSEPFIKRIGKMAMPVIVPISTPVKWKSEKVVESYIARLIRRAIGYQIKIKR